MKNLLSKIFRTAGRLHLGLYALFALMLFFGRSASFFFEQYSLIDFDLARTEWEQALDAHAKGGSHKVSAGAWKRIFRPVYLTKTETITISGGKKVTREKYQTKKQNDDIYFLFLLAWLWPLYRHYFAKKKPDPARVGRRIIQLPLFIFALGWLIAVLQYSGSLLAFKSLYGPVPLRLHLVFASSALMFGTFVGYLNLEVTAAYIRRYIARPFFLETDPYGLKRGFAINLTLRYALMIFSLAMVPLLLALYIPVMSNLDLFARLGASLARRTGWEWALAYDNMRVFVPILLVGSLAAVNLAFQLVSILLYRGNVQAPVSALVGRMRAVAAGDFNCKTTVLYADELGQLKGHFNLMLDGLVERDRIKDTFGRYVSMEIAEKIMKSGKVNLAGEEIQATVLFSDICGFTPLSEKMPPAELIKFLNDYFSYVTGPIADNRGVINKFIGDAVMAIFSPVFGVEDHREAAVRAALGMRAALKRFNAEAGHPEINFGVGIHSGGLVAGNVGTQARLEYTVLGDTVNVAARIETQTRTAATQILLSQAVMDGVDKAHFPGVNFIQCAPVLMKGKSHPMVLYKAEPASA